ncbi:MAG: hypothetical protein H7833_16865 [Magnetococcus sp. DMHC-1]|nr:cytochrome C [Magnetococcales bacterium]
MSPVLAEGGAEDALCNTACLKCHDGSKKYEILDASPNAGETGKRFLTAITPELYGRGVHARLLCKDCHDKIRNLNPPHQSGAAEKIDCAACHVRLAKAMQEAETVVASSRMETVIRHTINYRRSFHARPNKDNPDFPNAVCHECHDTHFFNVPVEKHGPDYDKWRLTIPELCGKCHEEALEDYAASSHGVGILEKSNSKSANCSDCHTTYSTTGAHLAVFKLMSSETCGACHPKSLDTYRQFYHGQVTRLGFHHTAKCYDCHESHKVLPAKDPKSTVHPDKRLRTCQKCHDGQHRPLATAGFASFSPHANENDYDHYPQLWYVSRFMRGLMWSVLSFFTLHSVLWYYREWRERQQSPVVLPLNVSLPGVATNPHVQRFSLFWRVLHLFFVLAVMVLLLTGTTFLNAHLAWAPPLAHLLGGAERMGLLHRAAALCLVGIFLFHLVFVLQSLLRKRNFAWFGPDSLLPNKKDFLDCRDMFKWFFGRGPRPGFDRWTYFEKFDYWAVFWGMTIFVGSGLVLAFPHVAGRYLDGWVFNVAILVHGREALLATVFLFTIHFFNNHFRPAKFPPPDISMFTGNLSLAELRRDHPAQFERLQSRGELQSLLVRGPSRGMLLGARLLGALLLVGGLTLLFLMGSRYFW